MLVPMLCDAPATSLGPHEGKVSEVTCVYVPGKG